MAHHHYGSWNLESKAMEPWAYYRDCFPEVQCEGIIDICESLTKESAGTYGDQGGIERDREFRKNTISWLPSLDPKLEFVFRRCTDVIKEINSQFWQFELDYIESLQYTIYDQLGDHYDQHTDFDGSGVHMRKLSFSILLDDPQDWEGGDLEFYYRRQPDLAPRQRGTMIVFPSFMLHRVTPITRGRRRSLVGWVCGPRFR